MHLWTRLWGRYHVTQNVFLVENNPGQLVPEKHLLTTPYCCGYYPISLMNFLHALFTEDPLHSLHKACDKCGGQASDTILKTILRHGASQQTALLRPRCTRAPNRRSSSCYTGCSAEATIVLEATSREAKLDMATSGHGRRPSDELRHPYHLVEGSRLKRIASHRGHSNAPAGVGYEERRTAVHIIVLV